MRKFLVEAGILSRRLVSQAFQKKGMLPGEDELPFCFRA